MLYKIRDQVSVFEDNPELYAIPEFAKLTDRQMRYVMLTADRRSPLRTLPEKQKKEKAARLSGWGMEGNRLDRNGREVVAGGVASIEAAIAIYKSYQHDENAETLETINAQIQEIKEYLKSDKSEAKDVGKALEQAAKLGERLPGLVEAKQKLETLLQVSMEQKPEIITYSSADIPDDYFQEGSQDLPAIELFMQQKQKQSE